MYTYKRFRTSKSAVIIVLIALALVAWGILGSTGTTLAGGKVTLSVTLDVTTDMESVTFNDGTAQWPILGTSFKGRDDLIEVVVEGVVKDMDLIGVCLNRKRGNIVGAMVYFRDKEDGTGYEGVTDVEEQTPFLPDVGGEPLIVKIDKTIGMRKLGKGGKGNAEPLWTVYIGDAVYTR